MDTKTIKTAAERELHGLSEKKEKLERRMKALLQIIEGCNAAEKADTPEAASESEKPPSESQINAVRNFLQRATQAVAPPEIRDALQGAGYSASSPKHLLITVHGILDRLECAGEVRRVGNAYVWIPEMQRLINRGLTEWGLGPLPRKGRLSDMK